ncbi:hypothetical protein, partial [Vibrio parahaemolyticus]|uniref:hypothetical protein n=1 Tax=Vibrio parahaemolyticus TaxID=670 RepID=UPI00047027B7
QVSFVVGFSVSETDFFVESQLCNIVFSKEFFLVLLVRFLRRYLFQVVSVTGVLKLRLILVFQNT